MNDWREENFLERLIDSSRKDAAVGECPTAQSLCAKIEAGDLAAASDELGQHVRDCPACSEILRRLALFEQTDATDSDPETIAAKGRLDSWMKGFLSAQSPRPKTAVIVMAPKVTQKKHTVPQPRFLWRMKWAFAAAATVIIAVSLVYIRRSITAPAPKQEVAQHAPSEQPPEVQPEQPRVEARPATPSGETAHAHKPSRTSSPGTAGRSSSVQAPEASKESGTEIAAQKPPTEVPSLQAANGNPTVSPTVQPTPVMLGQGQSSQASLPSSRGMNSKPQTTSLTPPKSGVSTSSRVGMFSPTGQRTIQLPAGTRVWLTLTSVNSLPGGHFQFQASLLLPVTDAKGAVLFEKSAQVLGSGQTIDGKTSVQITEIASQGLRYRSTSSQSGALNRPASAKVVSFQSGQILETWLDSPSTFSIDNGASANPQQ